MNRPTESQGHPNLNRATRLACAVAGIIAAAALLGWQFDLPALRAPLPGSVSMNPLTAVAFLLASASLLGILRTEPGARTTHLARLSAAIVAVIGTVKLFSLLTGIDLLLDQALFHDKLAGVTPPNQMAPNTAAAFLLLGSGLLALRSGARRARKLAEILLLATTAMSLAALIGYLYGAPRMYGIGAFIPMAVNTACAFLLISVGALLARPDSTLRQLLVSTTPGGLMARRLLPAAILVPFVLGWFRLEGQRRGLYGLEMGTTMMCLAIVAVLVGIVWVTGRGLDAADRRREQVELGVKRMQMFLDSIVENLPNMLFVKNAADLRFVRLNRAAEELMGYKREELLGKNDYNFFSKEQADFFTAKDRQVLDSRTQLEIAEEVITTRTKGERLLHTKKVPVLDVETGEPMFLLGISEDITDRRQAEKQIEALHREARSHAQQLEIANGELEAFSYSVSHDLRAPLRHIAGFVDLLLRHNASQLDETGRRRLNAVFGSAQKMGQLIDDLLVFSRMGRTEMQRSKVNLTPLVQAIIAELEADTRERQIRWVIGPLPEVEGDPAMLRLVLTNLVSNAVKYTGTRAEAVIEIGAEEHADQGTVVFVRDNGVGFDMEYAGKLFGVFQRLHKQEEFPGTGIGLANVRRIIHRHGGKTWAEGALDRGATFYFSLPSRKDKEERWAA